jgi:hypothetical protein
MIWKVVIGLLIAAVVVPAVMAKLQGWANRLRYSEVSTSEREPVRLHTEDERWEVTFDMRHPEVAQAVEQQIEADALALFKSERKFQTGLDRLWAETKRVCQVSETDEKFLQIIMDEILSAPPELVTA